LVFPCPKPEREKVDVIAEDLEKRKAARPRTLKALRSSIQARFGNQLAEDELEKIVGELASRGVIKVADGKVSYEMAS